MGRHIDADLVYNAIQITSDKFGILKTPIEGVFRSMLSEIPTVEECKRGGWIRVINELNATHKCSNCGLGVNSKYINYCPQCGSHNFNGNEGVDNG